MTDKPRNDGSNFQVPLKNTLFYYIIRFYCVCVPEVVGGVVSLWKGRRNRGPMSVSEEQASSMLGNDSVVFMKPCVCL